MENYLLKIITSLVEKDVDFVICGGVACVLQGCERTTFDIDLYPKPLREKDIQDIRYLKELLKDEK